jgi:hypothetical protein
MIDTLDLSRFRAAPGARLSHLSFEGDRALPAQCWVAASRIVEAVDVFEDGHLSLPVRRYIVLSSSKISSDILPRTFYFWTPLILVRITGAFAKFKRNIIRKRQAEGIAKAKGLYNRRPKTIDDVQAKELKESGMGAIANELGTGRASVYKPLNGW